MTCIMVCGLLRTGTSLVSKQLHELGVPMGDKMRFPFAGEGGQLDWEDIECTDKCLSTLVGKRDIGSLHSFFQNYSLDRRSQGYRVWGVKSPYLLPYVDLFRRMSIEPVKIVLTTRNVQATYKSIERQLSHDQTALEGVIKLQDTLRNYEVPGPDLTIDITESWASPETVREKLAALISEE